MYRVKEPQDHVDIAMSVSIFSEKDAMKNQRKRPASGPSPASFFCDLFKNRRARKSFLLYAVCLLQSFLRASGSNLTAILPLKSL